MAPAPTVSLALHRNQPGRNARLPQFLDHLFRLLNRHDVIRRAMYEQKRRRIPAGVGNWRSSAINVGLLLSRTAQKRHQMALANLFAPARPSEIGRPKETDDGLHRTGLLDVGAGAPQIAAFGAGAEIEGILSENYPVLPFQTILL